MSDVVHYSTVPEGSIPKRFLCGRKCKEHTYTRFPEVVDCPQCRAKLKEKASSDAASSLPISTKGESK